MTKGSKVLFVSDIHGSKEAVKSIVSAINKEDKDDISHIILGGDIPDYTKQTMRWILRRFLTLKKTIIIYPGSHENSETYTSVLQEFTNNPLIIDGFRKEGLHLTINGWDAYFIPGSNAVSSGSKPFNGGNIHLVNEPDTPATKRKRTIRLKKLEFAKKASPIFYENLYPTIQQKRTTRDKSIVFSHIPPLCKTTNGIDLARFGKTDKEFVILNKHKKQLDNRFAKVEKTFLENSILALDEAKKVINLGYPMSIQHKNVGCKTLASLLRRYRISKLVCGHIHEAGPKAIDRQENTARQRRWNSSACINNGTGFNGHYTLLEFDENGLIKHQFKKANVEEKQ